MRAAPAPAAPLGGAAPVEAAPATCRPHDAIEQAGERRSARVESLRALAALGVLFGHVYAVVFPLADQRYNTYAQRIGLGGGFGVYLFFALSGFLLYRPFARRDIGGGAAIDLRRYAVNRAVRILPLYYTVVAVMLLATQHGGSFGQWATFGVFAENFRDASYIDRVNGVVWSLVLEVQFYVLLPFIAMGINRIARGSAWRAAAVLIVAAVLSDVLRWTLVHKGLDNTLQWRHAFPTSFVWFVPGMLLAIAAARRDMVARVLRGRLLGSSTVWLIAAAGAWMLVFYNYSLDGVLLLACLLTAGGCVLPLRAGAVTRALEWRGLAAIGVASYSLYLWHQPIVLHLAPQSWAPHSLAGLTAVAVPLAITAAALSYLVIERPFLRLRRRWSSESAPITAA